MPSASIFIFVILMKQIWTESELDENTYEHVSSELIQTLDDYYENRSETLSFSASEGSNHLKLNCRRDTAEKLRELGFSSNLSTLTQLDIASQLRTPNKLYKTNVFNEADLNILENLNEIQNPLENNRNSIQLDTDFVNQKEELIPTQEK